jgi:hypothetical protein
MQCVSYDSAFQLELCNKFPLYVSSRKSSSKKSKVTGRHGKRKREESPGSDSNDDEREFKGKSSPKKSKVAHKRKRPSSDSQDSDDLFEDEDDVPTYRSRGTRSRPICL